MLSVNRTVRDKVVVTKQPVEGLLGKVQPCPQAAQECQSNRSRWWVDRSRSFLTLVSYTANPALRVVGRHEKLQDRLIPCRINSAIRWRSTVSNNSSCSSPRSNGLTPSRPMSRNQEPISG